MYDTKKTTNQYNGILDTYSSVGQVSGYVNTTYYNYKRKIKPGRVCIYYNRQYKKLSLIRRNSTRMILIDSCTVTKFVNI